MYPDYSMRSRYLLAYHAIVQEIDDDTVTLYVLKDRNGPRGITKMSIESLNELKAIDRYRIERLINFDDVDLEQFVGLDSIFEYQIDGFYIDVSDAKKIKKILRELSL